MYSRIAGTGVAWALFGSHSRAASRQPSAMVIQTGSMISTGSGSGSTMRGPVMPMFSDAAVLFLSPPRKGGARATDETAALDPRFRGGDKEREREASQMVPRDLVLPRAAEEAGAVGVGVDVGVEEKVGLVAGHDDAG